MAAVNIRSRASVYEDGYQGKWIDMEESAGFSFGCAKRFETPPDVIQHVRNNLDNFLNALWWVFRSQKK